MSYLRLGLGIGVLLALIGAFFYGQHDGEVRCERAHLAAAAKVQAQQDQRLEGAQQQDLQAAQADVQRETIVREITLEVPKIIDRPVYRNVCVDADGVRLIERAVDAANGGSATGRPDGRPADLLAPARNGKSADR